MGPESVSAGAANYRNQLAGRADEFRDKGQVEGRDNKPPSGAVGPDANETDIVIAAEKVRDAQQTIFDSFVTDGTRQVGTIRAATGVQANDDRQIIADDSLIGKAEKVMADAHAVMLQATERRLRAEADYNYFRVTNGISEEPSYPSSRYLHFGLVAVLALLETFVNAVFYENSQGLLGGWMVALGVSAVNMGASIFLGMYFRYKNLRDPVWRVSGWLAGAIFIVFTVYCNAVFAAYRAQYQLIDPNSATELARAFRTAVGEAGGIFLFRLPFPDLTSFILFGLGLVLTCIAFYEGYTYDDRFPGHGPKHRALMAEKQAELGHQKETRGRLESLTNETLAKVQAAIVEPSKLSERLGRIASDLEHARTGLRAQAQAIQRDFALVVSAYRRANLAVRATPAPKHFSEPLPDLTVVVSDASAESLTALIAAVRAEIKELRDSTEDKLNAKHKELQTLSSEIVTGRYRKYLEQVKIDAEKAIDATTPRPLRAA